MTELESKPYKCVNCGEPAAALFKTYGPTVLKLTKCEKCKGIVDKYIEYDPVIVMIDLVLISKEAQRHVLYNTEFKSYWKLLIILIMLETYGVWRRDSLFNIVINTVCGIQSNNTIDPTFLSLPLNNSILDSWKTNYCETWTEETGDDTDLFIWEKDFYIKFLYTFSGIAVFILTIHIIMQSLKPFVSQNKGSVPARRALKALSLAATHGALALPTLVWGAHSLAHTRALHYALVLTYCARVCVAVFTVLYECPVAVTTLVLIVSYFAKFTASFYIAPYLRTFVT